MKGTCVDVVLFPSHTGDIQYPRPMPILWETTSHHIERDLCHDDVTRQIVLRELVGPSGLCRTVRHNIFMNFFPEKYIKFVGVTTERGERGGHLLRTRFRSRFSMDRMCRYWKKGHDQIHEDRTRRFIDSKIIDIRYLLSHA
jgi:hypothetical protein